MYQLPGTGIQHYIKALYQNLLKIDSENEYIFFQTDNNKTIGQTKLANSNNKHTNAAWFDLFAISKLINQEQDLRILHGPSNILPMSIKKGVKSIVTVHDLSFLLFPNNHSKSFNLYYKYAMKRTLKIADVIVADSNNTKLDIIRFYKIPEDKIRVIYPGITDNFFNTPRLPGLISSPYFFSLTTHPERKNITSVLEVLSKNKQLSGLTYIIAGVIPHAQEKALKEKIRKLDLGRQVLLYGYVKENELISLYQNAEFFIYPSFYEGFGFPVLEAMASRCPVITSNNSSLKEIAPDKNWLVDPYSLEDISDKMSKMVNLSNYDRGTLIQKNYNHAMNFSWEKTARKMLDVFTGLE